MTCIHGHPLTLNPFSVALLVTFLAKGSASCYFGLSSINSKINTSASSAAVQSLNPLCLLQNSCQLGVSVWHVRSLLSQCVYDFASSTTKPWSGAGSHLTIQGSHLLSLMSKQYCLCLLRAVALFGRNPLRIELCKHQMSSKCICSKPDLPNAKASLTVWSADAHLYQSSSSHSLFL